MTRTSILCLFSLIGFLWASNGALAAEHVALETNVIQGGGDPQVPVGTKLTMENSLDETIFVHVVFENGAVIDVGHVGGGNTFSFKIPEDPVLIGSTMTIVMTPASGGSTTHAITLTK